MIKCRVFGGKTGPLPMGHVSHVVRQVLATGAADATAGCVQAAKTVWFVFKPVQHRTLIAWRAKPRAILINSHVWLGLAKPIGSNPQFQYSGITIYGCIQLSDCSSPNIDFCISLSSSDVLPSCMIKYKWQPLPAPSSEWESAASQRLLVLQVRSSEWELDADINK
jgi:hypothetical protein